MTWDPNPPVNQGLIRAVYACTLCGEERVYGFDRDPDPAALRCQNDECPGSLTCAWHKFKRFVTGWIGKPCPLPPR